MTHIYDIMIEGQRVHQGISEDLFLELMVDFSTAYYETGFPHPNSISHTTYIKE